MKQLVLLALFGVVALAAADFDSQCLPTADPGPCKGYFPKWWYNVETGQCEEFIYGGCQGNDNRYDTKEECEKTCASGSGSLDVSSRKNHARQKTPETPDYSAVNLNAGVDFQTHCKPSADPGPCKGYFPRWWFNVKTGQCAQFIYSGCQGNKNNYGTRRECETSCLRRLASQDASPIYWPPHNIEASVDDLPLDEKEHSDVFLSAGVNFETHCKPVADPGPCHGHFPMWWFNVKTGQCEQFIYGGCQGNKNKYNTMRECEISCLRRLFDVSAVLRNSSRVNRTRHNKPNETSEYTPVVLAAGDDFNTYCKQRHDRGPCKAYLPRWWYNANTRRCEQFIYGGCQGNKNNYQTKAACEAKCLRRLSALEVSAEVQRYPDPKNNSEHWVNVTSEYNATNANSSQEASAIYSGPPRVAAHVDHLPPDDDEQTPVFLSAGGNFNAYCKPRHDRGPCMAHLPRWWYNANARRCQKFIYGGCQGNRNNYRSKAACETKCLRRRSALEVSAVVQRYPDPKKKYERWVNETSEYNATDTDYDFIRSKLLSNLAALDPVCKLPKKPGRCLAYIPRYYYNTTTGTCQRFIYGGCEGNENNFETLKQCQAKCAPVSLRDAIRANPILSREAAVPNPVCNEPKYSGPCLGYFPRYYFNNVTKRCEKFIYRGCRGNRNNFHTLEECQNTCWVSLDQDAAETVDAAELTLWPFSPPEQCTYAADPGPCTAYMPRFFYNTLSKTCEMFVYGGCGGNSNNFHTYDDCQKTCKKFFGVIPRA